MKNLLALLMPILLFGCSFGYKDIVGVINGKTIYESDLIQRLNLTEQSMEASTIDQKRQWFEEVVRQVSLEDEAKRSKMDMSNLMRFFTVVDQIEVSATEKASFLEQFPAFKSRPESEVLNAIKKDRRDKIEAKYKQEVLDKTAREFMADNPKRSKVQNFWNKLSF